jgi:hypothetical protein
MQKLIMILLALSVHAASAAASVIADTSTITTTLLLISPNALPATIPGMPSTANFNWTAPALNTDGSQVTGVVTYNVYQGALGALVKVQSGITGLSVSVTAGITPGSQQCFAVSATENGVESAPSQAACVTVPLPMPGAPSATIRI